MSLIAESKRVANNLAREVRTISYLSHPPLLDEFGPSKALEWYVDALQKRSGIKIKPVSSADLDRLLREYQFGIFGLLHKCLLNIQRNLGSQTARIVIEQRPERLFLQAQDQGKGIAPDKLSRLQSTGAGVGLRGMNERIGELGGVLKIESDKGGTRVLVNFTASKQSITRQTDAGVVRFRELSEGARLVLRMVGWYGAI